MFLSQRRVYRLGALLLVLLLTACKLTVKIDGEGTVNSVSGNIDCGDICVVEHEESTVEILTARPAEGYKFVGWAGSCSGRDACTLTISNTSGNKTARAVFAPLQTVPLRPMANPKEYVGMTIELPLNNINQFLEIADPLFGSSAKNGSYLTQHAIEPGVWLSSSPFPGNPEQVIIEAVMEAPSDEVEPKQRILMQVPASLQHGQLFIDIVKVAKANMDSVVAGDPADAEPYHIEYRSNSPKGGHLKFALIFDGNETILKFDIQSPHTSLFVDQINLPALQGDPFETIYAMVNFSLIRDQFDFFATRAYGFSAGKDQNFNDFQLLPHEWLRLTVEPQLDDQLVNVGFEVVTLDGDRLAVARAPASAVAGEQFMHSVFRKVDNMLAQEAYATGSSRPWQVPFYYDDPEGGGIVEVVAKGVQGRFQIAYVVETPIHTLQDVDFIPFQGNIDIPDDWQEGPAQCDTLTPEEPLGKFNVNFFASSTIHNSNNLDGPLTGPIWGSIFRAEDVTIVGPKSGAEAVADFHFDNVDISDRDNGSPNTYLIDTALPAGKYQILGFMDIDGNADVDSPHPDKNDPVMIPIGGYTLTCIEQPTQIEFAILNP